VVYCRVDLVVLILSHTACLLLLLQVKCPFSGVITIRGQPVTNPGCCGITTPGSGLFLYSGGYSSTKMPITGQADSNNINFSTQCNEGDTYTLCEKQGIFLTDTVSYKFVGVYPKECPATCKQLSCTGNAV
jgi:hypothetical protein